MKQIKALLFLPLLMAAMVPASAALSAAPDEFNIIPMDLSGFVLSPEASIDEEGGSYVLSHESADMKWTYSTYSFPVDANAMRSLQFLYKYRVTDVKMGENSWDTARIFVNYFDEDGKHINDWPSPGFWKGSTDWKDGKWSTAITKGAVKATVSIGLNTCSGLFQIKDLAVYALDAQKNKVKPLPIEE